MDETRQGEYVTLTVVVRAGGEGEEDPCETALGIHPDVMFVGHTDGITTAALALGADPDSWI